MNHQKPVGRFLCKQSSLQVQEKNFEDYDHIKGSPRSPKNDSTSNSINCSKDFGSYASKQEFTSFSTTVSSQYNIRTKAFDVCPFCCQKISDVETTLYCESLNFNELGMFYYHSDCWKDGVLLSPDILNTILHADYEFKGDNLLPKLRGDINEDALISIKIYHPLSTVLIGKILINDALQEKKDKVTSHFIQLIILTYDFKSDSVLYQVGTLFLPLCFLRLGVSLNYKDESELKKIENEFILNVVTECVNRNVEISFVPSFLTQKNKNTEILLYGRLSDKIRNYKTLFGNFVQFMENNKLLEEKGYIQIKRIQIILNKTDENYHSSLTPIEESSNEHQKETSSGDLSSKRDSKSSNRLSVTSVKTISENEEEKKGDWILNRNLSQSSIEMPKFLQNITEPIERFESTRKTEKSLLKTQEMMPRTIQPPKNLTKETKQKKKQGPSKVSAETNLPSINEIEGNVLEIAMNQSGSRTLQRFVEKANQQEIEIVLMEILPHLESVIRDDYANYMFQAICLRCTPKMRLTIVKAIAGDIVSLAMHKKGTHSLQALISAMNTESEAVIFMTLIASHVSRLSKDGHGTYFIQKIIFCFSNKVVRALLDIVLGDFESIVCNQYGVCVIKAIINKYCGNNSPEQSFIITKIVDNMDELIQDPFGNYAVKQILDVKALFIQKCEFLSVQSIVIRVLEKFLCLSLQKFSSYIVEKCLILFYQDIKECIQDFVNEEIISELSNNNYGCHVLKTMVECMAGFDRQSLIYVGSCAYSIIKNSQNSTQKEFLVKIVQFIQKF